MPRNFAIEWGPYGMIILKHLDRNSKCDIQTQNMAYEHPPSWHVSWIFQGWGKVSKLLTRDYALLNEQDESDLGSHFLGEVLQLPIYIYIYNCHSSGHPPGPCGPPFPPTSSSDTPSIFSVETSPPPTDLGLLLLFPSPNKKTIKIRNVHQVEHYGAQWRQLRRPLPPLIVKLYAPQICH